VPCALVVKHPSATILIEPLKRFIEGADREQSTLLPDCLDDWIDESNPVRAVDVFVDGLNLAQLGFDGVVPEATGRPSYHPSALLKLYIYGYLNRIQSSRWLEREAGRNLEVIWLVRRLTPDDKTIADFRKDNGPAIRKVCAQFVALCRQMSLLTKASVAIDGSKFVLAKPSSAWTRSTPATRTSRAGKWSGDVHNRRIASRGISLSSTRPIGRSRRRRSRRRRRI
jgi:transposase